MKKIVFLLTVALLTTLHVARVDADYLSHKNMVRVERISSACALPLLIAGIKNKNLGMFITATGCQVVNIMANMALGFGHTKDKKAFLRMVPQAVVLGSIATIFSTESKAVRECCQKFILVGLLGMGIKEVTDVYSLVTA